MPSSLDLQAENGRLVRCAGRRSRHQAQIRATLPRDVHRRRDAVLALGPGKVKSLEEGNICRRQDRSRSRPTGSRPDLVPAAVMAARILRSKRAEQPAQRDPHPPQENLGRQQPHPGHSRRLRRDRAGRNACPERPATGSARSPGKHPNNPETRYAAGRAEHSRPMRTSGQSAHRRLGDLAREPLPTARIAERSWQRSSAVRRRRRSCDQGPTLPGPLRHPAARSGSARSTASTYHGGMGTCLRELQWRSIR